MLKQKLTELGAKSQKALLSIKFQLRGKKSLTFCKIITKAINTTCLKSEIVSLKQKLTELEQTSLTKFQKAFLLHSF